MKVTIAGKELKIYWRYRMELDPKEVDNPRYTTAKIVFCHIEIDGKPITENSASCHHKDRFREETGRKISLTRALKDILVEGVNDNGFAIIGEAGTGKPMIGRSLTKAERTQIWAAYRKRGQLWIRDIFYTVIGEIILDTAIVLSHRYKDGQGVTVNSKLYKVEASCVIKKTHYILVKPL